MIRKMSKRKFIIFSLIIIIAFTVSGLRLLWENELSGAFAKDCSLEYGNGRCIDGKMAIPFHNPNTRDITYMQIFVPYGVETSIALPADYVVNEQFRADSSNSLSLFPCENDVDVRALSVKWCCGDECYRSSMSWPNSELFLEVNE